MRKFHINFRSTSATVFTTGSNGRMAVQENHIPLPLLVRAMMEIGLAADLPVDCERKNPFSVECHRKHTALSLGTIEGYSWRTEKVLHEEVYRRVLIFRLHVTCGLKIEPFVIKSADLSALYQFMMGTFGARLERKYNHILSRDWIDLFEEVKIQERRVYTSPTPKVGDVKESLLIFPSGDWQEYTASGGFNPPEAAPPPPPPEEEETSANMAEALGLVPSDDDDKLIID